MARVLFINAGSEGHINPTINGVPLIVIPQSADQPIIARQVANIGAGINLQMQGLNANQLYESADDVLNLSKIGWISPSNW